MTNYKNLLIFFIAFLIYNNGVQTVIQMAAAFGREELKFGYTTLLGTVLLIQFVGVAGVLLFGKIAKAISAKKAIILNLIIWIGI